MSNVVSTVSIVVLAVVLLLPPVTSEDASRSTRELCSPARISLGESLTLRLPDPSLDELAVSDPLGRWFYLQGSGAIQPLLGTREFAEAATITLNSSTIVGTLYEDGYRVESPVFTVPGPYTVHLADDLETEPENALYFECQVMVSGGHETGSDE